MRVRTQVNAGVQSNRCETVRHGIEAVRLRLTIETGIRGGFTNRCETLHAKRCATLVAKAFREMATSFQDRTKGVIR